ncbi:Hypothetical_protein [Hexamita inflata]|uniref:Hypothetical_protein n=1 Tax=Hexamita inflata TaxID=28002 RepID=A0AA86PKZ5_9EUKA|nr:Hypothetical protein HINF_LOCUS28061 [Hexamita inflata]
MQCPRFLSQCDSSRGVPLWVFILCLLCVSFILLIQIIFLCRSKSVKNVIVLVSLLLQLFLSFFDQFYFNSICLTVFDNLQHVIVFSVLTVQNQNAFLNVQLLGVAVLFVLQFNVVSNDSYIFSVSFLLILNGIIGAVNNIEVLGIALFGVLRIIALFVNNNTGQYVLEQISIVLLGIGKRKRKTDFVAENNDIYV